MDDLLSRPLGQTETTKAGTPQGVEHNLGKQEVRSSSRGRTMCEPGLGLGACLRAPPPCNKEVPADRFPNTTIKGGTMRGKQTPERYLGFYPMYL